jgi:pyruvate dehydrogenase E1 component
LTDNVKLTRKEPKAEPLALRVLPKPESGDEGKWLESLESVLEFALKNQGPERTSRFLENLVSRLRDHGVEAPRVVTTPYVNTIPFDKQAPFGGDWEMERQIKSYVRWNAMAMVVNANRAHSGLGGHISTYASAATLYEVAFNHFLRARTEDFVGDMVYVQGHATPGI